LQAVQDMVYQEYWLKLFAWHAEWRM